MIDNRDMPLYSYVFLFLVKHCFQDNAWHVNSLWIEDVVT